MTRVDRLAALAVAADRDAALRASYRIFEEDCCCADTVLEGAPAAAAALTALLGDPHFPWRADALSLLDNIAYRLGGWAFCSSQSGRPDLYERQVTWEEQAAEHVAPVVPLARALLADCDPGTRAMAAALVGDAGDAGDDWTADLDLLLTACAAEPFR